MPMRWSARLNRNSPNFNRPGKFYKLIDWGNFEGWIFSIDWGNFERWIFSIDWGDLEDLTL